MTHLQDRRLALSQIHRVAIAKNLTLATAESLTAGRISAAIADTSGCSQYHQGGIVAYNLEAKVHMLNVDREMAESCNCVSSAVAMQMAMGARHAFGHADLVIAVTGYAEAWGDIEQPFAHYAILCGESCSQGTIHLDGLDRNEARDQVVTRTLCELAAMAEAVYARS